MNIYQKAIKVRKTCEIQKYCGECQYVDNCTKTNFLFLTPAEEDIKTVAKAIKEEKWQVK